MFTGTAFKQAQNGVYLNIDLTGSPLDGTKVGYPKKFKVQMKQPDKHGKYYRIA